MRETGSIKSKIYQLHELITQVARWKFSGRKIVFTNGVFDILHSGHLSSLCEAAGHGDILIVGLNSDASVKRLKGPERPVNNQEARSMMLAALLPVDGVILFEEDTPLELIKAIMPDVLVKGGDYKLEDIAGAAEVTRAGGKVVLAKMQEGISTTNIINKLK